MAQLKGGSYVGGDFIVATDLSANILKSLVSTGTAPLSVTSTTLVSNLNVQYLNGITSDVFATHRAEGTQYIDYSRYVFNNGAYSGSGWTEPSDLGVRYSGTSGITNAISTGATLNGGGGWAYLRFTGSNALWDIGVNQTNGSGANFEIRPNGGDTNRFLFGNDGSMSSVNVKISNAVYFNGTSNYWNFEGGAIHSNGHVSVAGSLLSSNSINVASAPYTDVAVIIGNWTGAATWGFGNDSSAGGHVLRFDQISGNVFQGATDVQLKLGTNTVWHGGNFSPGNYLALSGGTMSGKILTLSSATGTYGGAFEIRELGYVAANQSAWDYAPRITFHWGNRVAVAFGVRYDGQMAVNDNPISMSGHTHDYATHRGEGTNFIDYARLTYNNGAYSGGPAWVEPSDLGVRYANSSGTASTVRQDFGGSNVGDLLYSQMADNDFFRLRVGGTSTNAGFVEIATADDGTEPIYIRQYTGPFTSLARTLTLLDESGNTSIPGIVTINSALDSSFDNHNGALYVVGGIASGKSMQCHDLYTSLDASVGRDILVGGTGTFFGSSIEIGTNASYIYMHDDDETSNAPKALHANSNNIGFLSNGGSWLVRWDNSGFMNQMGAISASGSISTDSFFKCTGDYGLCGGYDATGTTAKVIWTIGTSWATIGSMYGLGYEYGGVSGYGHGLFMANAGSRTIHFDLSGGNAYYNGSITASNFVLNSDARIKHNIYPIQARDSGIKFMEFELDSTPGVKRYGVIAQQLLELGHYELVEGNDEDTYKVKYIDLIIKELAFLKSELSNVKNELFELKNKSI